MIGAVTTVFQIVYALVLLGVGLFGIFDVSWEMRHLYGLDPASLKDSATFLNQYRFLKAVEFGLGLFGVLFRREILAGGVETLVFLTAVGAGIVARLLAWVASGPPSTIFVLFLIFEVLTFFLVLAQSRRDPDQS